MLEAQKYYNYVNERFLNHNQDVFQGCDEKLLISRPVPDGLFDNLLKLLDRVEEKYEFNLQKMCALNFNKFILWQEEFCGGYKENELLAATKFIIFCCLVDKFLDSGRFSDKEKESICIKLQTNYFVSSEPYVSKEFTELDELLNDIRIFMIDDEVAVSGDRDVILESIDKALESEIYMYRNPLPDQEAFHHSEFNKLTDKSVEFEIAGFLMASMNHNSVNSKAAAACAGRIFWLTDDLCDFIEDVKYRRKNSALYYCIESAERIPLSQRVDGTFVNIDKFIERLEKEITLLKSQVGNELYTYLINEVWEWCSGVRRLAK
ncbi:MAG: hypothetical protein LUH55_10195 [Bacteroides thetaiotaomicron]|nr:hypothetical protein [Bacteroides thetaiotaomicron]